MSKFYYQILDRETLKPLFEEKFVKDTPLVLARHVVIDCAADFYYNRRDYHIVSFPIIFRLFDSNDNHIADFDIETVTVLNFNIVSYKKSGEPDE
jgi:hypothetical protein